MRLAREGIRQRVDFVGAHRVLTAAAGMAGKADVAKAALQSFDARSLIFHSPGSQTKCQ